MVSGESGRNEGKEQEMRAASVLGAVGMQTSSGPPTPALLCPASVSPCGQGAASSVPAARRPWELVEGLICHRPTVQSGETEAREILSESPGCLSATLPRKKVYEAPCLNRNLSRRAAGAGGHPNCDFGIWGASASWRAGAGEQRGPGAALIDAGNRNDG